jgi:hypothetical protein
VCGHDNKIEPISLGKLGDLCCCVTGQQNSWAVIHGKLRDEERVEFASSEVLLLFGNLGRWPYVELEPVVTVQIEGINLRHFGCEDNSRPLDLSHELAAVV